MAEIEELSADDRVRLMDEIVRAGVALRAIGEAWGRPVRKLNVGALGNITRQLHVHVVGQVERTTRPGPGRCRASGRRNRPATTRSGARSKPRAPSCARRAGP